MDAHSRRQAALDAIDAVLDGARADDAETEFVDFKEEKSSIDSNGTRRAISAQRQEAARAMAQKVACFANSSQGGVLIVGVNDRESESSS